MFSRSISVKKKFCQSSWLFLSLLSSITLLTYYYFSSNPSWISKDDIFTFHEIITKGSEWKCSGEGRGRICEVTNFCVNNNDAFIFSGNFKRAFDLSSTIPKINVMSSDEPSDHYYQPNVRKLSDFHSHKIHYINDTIFVYGLYAPFHFSHWLYNGLIPLYSTMREFNATRKSWILRVDTTYQYTKKIYSHYGHDTMFLADEGKEIVNYVDEVLTSQQILAPSIPVCFARGVIGTGNRCSLRYCENNIPSTDYEQFSKDVFSYYVDNERWNFYSNNANLNSQQLACIDKSRELASNSSGSSDIIIKIGILQRYHNRRILNIDKLIDALINEQGGGYKFIVKFLNFDSGCSLQATAKLLSDIDILMSPHGSGIGAALFMRKKTTVISLDSRHYHEDWFSYVLTSVGRRFYNFECQEGDCQVSDFEMAKKVLDRHGVTLEYLELLEFLGPEVPKDLHEKISWKVYAEYAKDANRRVTIDRLLRFIKNEIVNVIKLVNKTDYVSLCKMGKCCGPTCDESMSRNVFGKLNSWNITYNENVVGKNWIESG